MYNWSKDDKNDDWKNDHKLYALWWWIRVHGQQQMSNWPESQCKATDKFVIDCHQPFFWLFFSHLNSAKYIYEWTVTVPILHLSLLGLCLSRASSRFNTLSPLQPYHYYLILQGVLPLFVAFPLILLPHISEQHLSAIGNAGGSRGNKAPGNHNSVTNPFLVITFCSSAIDATLGLKVSRGESLNPGFVEP